MTLRLVEPPSDVVDLCRRMLELAEAGDLDGVAVVAVAGREVKAEVAVGDADVADLYMGLHGLASTLLEDNMGGVE